MLEIALSASPLFDEISIGANGAEVRRASEWLDMICRQRNVPSVQVERLVVCLNEVLANIIAHGGSAAISAPVRLRLEVRVDAECSSAGVTVSDAGMAFDPLSVAEKTLPRTLAEASPGGLGLVMLRNFSDWLHYRHEDGMNQLTFGARWNPQ